MKRFSFLSVYILLMAIPSIIMLSFVYHSFDIKALLMVTIATFFVGGILEIWAVRQGKKDKFYIWEYNPRTTLNKKVMGVAIEDLTLFLLLTPIFTISVWETSKKLISVYNIPIAMLIVGGIAFVLTSYSIVFSLTKPRKRER
ncbi:MAG TPA: hypothetical protein VKC53_00165 [Patescibacteria group bacterium]|nr:hypothetical protein [Patescibacteria group bacterium]